MDAMMMVRLMLKLMLMMTTGNVIRLLPFPERPGRT